MKKRTIKEELNYEIESGLKPFNDEVKITHPIKVAEPDVILENEKRLKIKKISLFAVIVVLLAAVAIATPIIIKAIQINVICYVLEIDEQGGNNTKSVFQLVSEDGLIIDIKIKEDAEALFDYQTIKEKTIGKKTLDAITSIISEARTTGGYEYSLREAVSLHIASDDFNLSVREGQKLATALFDFYENADTYIDPKATAWTVAEFDEYLGSIGIKSIDRDKNKIIDG